MAITKRPRRRPQAGRRPFQRRLTWQEVEEAFDQLFRLGPAADEAKYTIIRFKRARTQMMPVLSWLCVSPYERERGLGLEVVERVGGQAAVRMLDDLLDDADVYEAFKRDLRGLREKLDGGAKPRGKRVLMLPDDEEDEELAEGAAEGEELEEAEGDEVAAADQAEPAEPPTEPPAERTPRQRRRPKPLPKPAAASAAVFDTPESFLAALDGPIEPVLAAFGELPEARRLSFVERVGRLDDDRVVGFLLPLLERDEWALVQSALNALGHLGRPTAIPAVRQIAENAQRKRVQLRAQRVLERLLEAPPAVAEPPAEPAAEPTAETDEAPRTGRRRRRRRRGGGRDAALEPQPIDDAPPEPPADEAPEPVDAEPADDDEPEAEPDTRREPRGDLGVLPPPEFAPLPRPAVAAASPVPKLLGCLAGPITVDGRQRLEVWREDGDAAVRLRLELSDRWGVTDAALTPRPAGALAAADGVEVPASYVRARLDEVLAGGAPEPDDLKAILAWAGPKRKTETQAAPAGEAPGALDRDAVAALLDSPFFAGWRMDLAADGRALGRWLATRGRRSASRIRRRLIDETVDAWLDHVPVPTLELRLRRQAFLLQKTDRALAASLAGMLATLIDGPRAHDHELLREMAYRGFVQAAGAAATARRQRRQLAWMGRRRRRLANITRTRRIRARR